MFHLKQTAASQMVEDWMLWPFSHRGQFFLKQGSVHRWDSHKWEDGGREGEWASKAVNCSLWKTLSLQKRKVQDLPWPPRFAIHLLTWGVVPCDSHSSKVSYVKTKQNCMLGVTLHFVLFCFSGFTDWINLFFTDWITEASGALNKYWNKRRYLRLDS